MRLKQRPSKSSRHKSVTLLNDSPQTSFEHNNVRHMDDVMRLAFLENNDITPETWKDIDFNSLSTASILKRNIQQQLQQQLKEQELKARQEQQLLFQQQLLDQQQQERRNRVDEREAAERQLQASRRQEQLLLQQQLMHRQKRKRQAEEREAAEIVDRQTRHQEQLILQKRLLQSQIRREKIADSIRWAESCTQVANERAIANDRETADDDDREEAHDNDADDDNDDNDDNVDNDDGELVESMRLGRGSPKSTPAGHSGEYPCDEPDCGKSFPSLRKLRHHKVVHSNDFPFHCQFKGCEKKFKRKFGIDLHSTTHFNLDPEMYRKTSNNSSLPFFGRRMQYSMCKPCGQKFKTVLEYQQHMLNHGKEPFKCPVKGCGQTFGIWKSFQKHRASHYFNYYCQMDSRCEHFTSNLQLLKLHIYCCHFQRKLPANATLSSKDSALDECSSKNALLPSQEDSLVEAEEDLGDEESIVERDTAEEETTKKETSKVEAAKKETATEEATREEESDGETVPLEIDESIENSHEESAPSTPRRDPRLRRNPPRSSTFGHQDYASISNGSSFAKVTMASPSSKRARTSTSSSATKTPEKTPPKVTPRRSCATSTATATTTTTTSPRKELSKQPLKMIRSAQMQPVSRNASAAMADDDSTEDENGSETSSSRNHSRNTDSVDNNGDNWDGGFKCHLCDYKFSVRFQLTKHLSTHLELSPDMYSATADAMVIKISERRRREFFCDKCHVKFEQMSDLDSHMRKHGQRPYVCSFCQVPSSFRMAKQYLSHLYEHRFSYKCTMSPDCDFTINRKDALKLHIFRMHMNQKLPAYIESFANMVDCNEWTD